MSAPPPGAPLRGWLWLATLALCILGCALMLLLNPGSLTVDLVYQGF